MSQYVASAFDHEMSNFAVFCILCYSRLNALMELYNLSPLTPYHHGDLNIREDVD